ncbi:DUF2071 domain-containing protein [Salinibacterium sp. SYSU T00001]|uniref:YqjF family protein n=1 Tax=Homoserinimonas sedimenticola TaxID=2986805 RepID=UPI0022357E3A|nr:DUF2071 domain-containing protein [Salinibacterium sedimenticola]MCW4386598.1 DUF2071 domain-containing protein [Salinibacterium sedimenticola]
MQAITREAPPLQGPPIIRQRWSEVSFLHWRISSRDAERMLPPGLRADVFDGSSWVGLICFRLSDSALLGSPPVPYVGTFPEVNVRLYTVDAEGRRGVWFVSLEASRLAAVMAANLAFALPYRWARMSIEGEAGELRYRSHRMGRMDARAHVATRASDTPVDDERSRFLTARWGMHTARGGRLRWHANVHEPWRLVEAELLECEHGLFAAAGIRGVKPGPPESVLAGGTVHARFARSVRVPASL